MRVLQPAVALIPATIYRCLGYKDPAAVPPRVAAAIGTLIAECRRSVTPRVFYRELPFTADEAAGGIVFGNGLKIANAAVAASLAQADRLIAAAVTLGPAIDEAIGRHFRADRPFQGFVLDTVANIALRDSSQAALRIWADAAAQNGRGLTGRLSPGDDGWELADQAILLALAGAPPAEVSLNDHFMLRPGKSVTMVYGLGRGLPAPKADHCCSGCLRPGCSYRADEPPRHKVVVAGQGEAGEFYAEDGDNLLELLRLHNFPVDSPCGGNHTCGKCRVLLQELTAAAEDGPDAFQSSLACLTDVRADIRVTIGERPAFYHILADSAAREADGQPRGSTRPEGGSSRYGVAVDIGTTTVVAYLMAMATGKQFTVRTALNPQAVHGADVISRIQYSADDADGLRNLQAAIIGTINDMLAGFQADTGIAAGDVGELVAAGNTTMLHLLLGVSCASLGRAPYTPAFTAARSVKARELQIAIAPGGDITVMPSVSGFVGADVVAGVLASRMYKRRAMTLLVDIGTNGEIVLGNKDGLVCCSTAAGPAFEGARIRCGVGAVEGAISHFGLAAGCSTIGGKPPIGICGTGLVDIAAELLRCQVINKTGRMLRPGDANGSIAPAIRKRLGECDAKPAFMVTADGKIFITQADIRELQLAKGAIHAGINVLCASIGITPAEVDEVLLAGGFGSYMDTDNAIAIKLFPAAFNGKVRAIGNASGSGARLALLSGEQRRIAADLAVRMSCLELSTRKDFAGEFARCLGF